MVATSLGKPCPSAPLRSRVDSTARSWCDRNVSMSKTMSSNMHRRYKNMLAYIVKVTSERPRR